MSIEPNEGIKGMNAKVSVKSVRKYFFDDFIKKPSNLSWRVNIKILLPTKRNNRWVCYNQPILLKLTALLVAATLGSSGTITSVLLS